ncbi:unnamed protein product, partial [Amoebophrya sp. A25]|eukprot:GSA25T00020427001.1
MHKMPVVVNNIERSRPSSAAMLYFLLAFSLATARYTPDPGTSYYCGSHTSCYAVLGTNQEALLAIVEDDRAKFLRRLYRETSKKAHPDLVTSSTSSTDFETVKRAFHVLADSKLRRAHDYFWSQMAEDDPDERLFLEEYYVDPSWFRQNAHNYRDTFVQRQDDEEEEEGVDTVGEVNANSSPLPRFEAWLRSWIHFILRVTPLGQETETGRTIVAIILVVILFTVCEFVHRWSQYVIRLRGVIASQDFRRRAEQVRRSNPSTMKITSSSSSGLEEGETESSTKNNLNKKMKTLSSSSSNKKSVVHSSTTSKKGNNSSKDRPMLSLEEAAIHVFENEVVPHASPPALTDLLLLRFLIFVFFYGPKDVLRFMVSTEQMKACEDQTPTTSPDSGTSTTSFRL